MDFLLSLLSNGNQGFIITSAAIISIVLISGASGLFKQLCMIVQIIVTFVIAVIWLILTGVSFALLKDAAFDKVQNAVNTFIRTISNSNEQDTENLPPNVINIVDHIANKKKGQGEVGDNRK